MTIKELKEILNKYDDNARVLVDYTCDDDYYSFHDYELKPEEIKSYRKDYITLDLDKSFY